MSTLAFDDMVAVFAAQNMRNAEPGSGTKDGDDTLLRQWQVRPAEMAKMLVFDVHHRMSDRAEIVDQGDPVDAEPVADLFRPDDPEIVGELQYVAHDRASHGNGRGSRQGTPHLFAESFPGGLHGRRPGTATRRLTRPRSTSAMANLAWVPPIPTATSSIRARPRRASPRRRARPHRRHDA